MWHSLLVQLSIVVALLTIYQTTAFPVGNSSVAGSGAVGGSFQLHSTSNISLFGCECPREPCGCDNVIDQLNCFASHPECFTPSKVEQQCERIQSECPLLTIVCPTTSHGSQCIFDGGGTDDGVPFFSSPYFHIGLGVAGLCFVSSCIKKCCCSSGSRSSPQQRPLLADQPNVEKSGNSYRPCPGYTWVCPGDPKSMSVRKIQCPYPIGSAVAAHFKCTAGKGGVDCGVIENVTEKKGGAVQVVVRFQDNIAQEIPLTWVVSDAASYKRAREHVDKLSKEMQEAFKTSMTLAVANQEAATETGAVGIISKAASGLGNIKTLLQGKGGADNFFQLNQQAERLIASLHHAEDLIKSYRPQDKQGKGLNHYEVLGLEPGPQTTKEDISKGYKRLALMAHPDKSGKAGSVKAATTAWFRSVQEAHDVLSSDSKRAAYDKRMRFGILLNLCLQCVHSFADAIVVDQSRRLHFKPDREFPLSTSRAAQPQNTTVSRQKFSALCLPQAAFV